MTPDPDAFRKWLDRGLTPKPDEWRRVMLHTILGHPAKWWVFRGRAWRDLAPDPTPCCDGRGVVPVAVVGGFVMRACPACVVKSPAETPNANATELQKGAERE